MDCIYGGRKNFEWPCTVFREELPVKDERGETTTYYTNATKSDIGGIG